MPETKIVEKKKYIRELISNQLINISPHRRLLYKDLCRITKYINSSIFDENKCSIWYGYITNTQNIKKSTYINFFFRNKKVALHKLLYENFIGPLDDNCYLKFSCDYNENKGICCNIKHMIKYTYKKTKELSDFTEEKIVKSIDYDKLSIQFD